MSFQLSFGCFLGCLSSFGSAQSCSLSMHCAETVSGPGNISTKLAKPEIFRFPKKKDQFLSLYVNTA